MPKTKNIHPGKILMEEFLILFETSTKFWTGLQNDFDLETLISTFNSLSIKGDAGNTFMGIFKHFNNPTTNSPRIHSTNEA